MCKFSYAQRFLYIYYLTESKNPNSLEALNASLYKTFCG